MGWSMRTIHHALLHSNTLRAPLLLCVSRSVELLLLHLELQRQGVIVVKGIWNKTQCLRTTLVCGLNCTRMCFLRLTVVLFLELKGNLVVIVYT